MNLNANSFLRFGRLSCAIAFLLPFDSSAADLTSIVCEGDAVPGVPGEVVSSVQVFAINDAEDVVGEIRYNGGVMIFRGNPTGPTLEKVVAVGDSVSGAGQGSATVDSIQDAQVAGDGQVLVLANLDVGGSFPERAVLFGTPGNLTIRAYRGGSIAGFNINNIGTVEMNRSGSIAFKVGIDDGSTFTSGVWMDGVLVARTGVHYTGLPSGEGFFSISDVRLNDAGELVTSGSTQPLEGGSLRGGIWTRNAGGVYEKRMEVFETVSISGLPAGSNLQSPSVRTFASGSTIGYNAFISGSGIGFSNDLGWFVDKDSTTKLIAQEGGAVPGVAGATFPQASSGFDVDSIGRAMLFVRLATGGDVQSSNDKGVWVWDGNALTLKIREGDPAPGAPSATIGAIDAARLTSDGQLIVQATANGKTTVFKGNVTGGLQPVAGPGFAVNAPVDPTIVDSAGFGARDANNSEGSAQSASLSGLVAMEVFLPGSIECVVVNLPPATGPGAISGEVRIDVDGDGDFADVEDMVFDGVILRLFADDGTGTVTPTGSELDSVQAGGDGFYEFTNVPPGTYVVQAELTAAVVSSGYVINAPASRRRLAIVTEGATDSGRDFLCTIPAVITALGVNDTWLTGSQTDRSPLMPSADTAVLVLQPDLSPGGGLCADGVTPFVFRIQVNQLPLDQLLRWECSVVSGGSVVGGLYPQMRSLVSGAWIGASEAGPNHVTPIAPGTAGAGTAFVALFPLRPDRVVLDTPARELEIELRVFNASSDELMAKTLNPIKIRRPPVFLIGSEPSEVWETPFLDGLKTSRAPDFIRELSFESTEAKFDDQFGFYYDMADVLADLQWEAEVASIRQQWAMTHPDVISHGNGAEFVMGLSLKQGLDGDFRNAGNFHRGQFRNAIMIGAPLVTRIGIMKSYANLMEQAIRQQGLVGVAEVGHLPETLKKVRGWSGDPGDLPARIRLTQDINRRKVYDELAPVHLIATKIDPSASQLFKQIGFTAQAQAELTPNGTDGVVAVEDALLGFRGFESESLLPPLIAHGEDTDLLGGVPKQTASDGVGQRAVFMLDQTGGSTFLSAAEIESARSSLTFHETDRLREMLDYLIGQTLRPGKVATLIDLLGGSPAPPEESDSSEILAFESPPPATTHTIELQEAPGESLTAGPFWYAEVFGLEGVTSDGVTLTPNTGNPYRVEITVDDGVVGDVVLYATYEVSNGVVFATPIRVVSNEPDIATAESITLRPDGVVLDLGDEVRPELTVHYSDGSSARRWLTADDVTVASSMPGVVDVAEELVWKADAVGTSTITLIYGGLSDQVAIEVVNHDAPQTYASWRGGMFDATQLTNPLVSGDTADIDLDGLNTFMEYITGGDPLVPDFDQLPRLTTVNPGPGPCPAVVFRVSKRIAGEDIDLEQSGDLSIWTDLLPDLSVTPSEGGNILAVIDAETFYELWIDVGNPLAGRQFFRLGINNDETPPLTATGTTEFVFGGYSSTGYGDRVTSTMEGSFVYEGADAFTPNVEALFIGSISPWTSGYGDLQDVVYAGAGPMRIDLVADFGFAVKLDHFDLAGYFGDFTIGSIEVQDGSGSVLWSQQNVVAPQASHLRLDFSGLNLSSNILTVVVDATNLGSQSDDVGLDNLQFQQIPTAPLTNWTMLTFDAGLGDFFLMEQSYGDRVTGPTMGGFSYVGAGSFTPGIVAAYEPVNAPYFSTSGYGLLESIVYKWDGVSVPLDITLTADAGQNVRLLGFDLAGYTSSDYVLNSVKVLDGANAELYSESNFALAGARTRLDFSAAPLQGDQLTIRIDSNNLGIQSDNVGIDNISFEQIPAD